MLWDEPKIFFLERRYFFSIILSEFLKNRVALQQEKPPWGVRVRNNTLREEEIGEAPPVADEASRFRGSGTIGAPERARES